MAAEIMEIVYEQVHDLDALQVSWKDLRADPINLLEFSARKRALDRSDRFSDRSGLNACDAHCRQSRASPFTAIGYVYLASRPLCVIAGPILLDAVEPGEIM